MKYLPDIITIGVCLMLIAYFLPMWNYRPIFHPTVRDNRLNITYNCTALLNSIGNSNVIVNFNYSYYADENPLQACKGLIAQERTNPTNYQYVVMVLLVIIAIELGWVGYNMKKSKS